MSATLDSDEDFLLLESNVKEPDAPTARSSKNPESAEYDSMDDDDGGADMSESSGGDGREDDGDDDMWKPKTPRLPPWIDRATVAQRRTWHPLTALHNEIVSFVHLMEPLPSEMEQREQLVERIRATVARHFGDNGVEVQVFGSQATGLFLPTSDIDLVVITKEDSNDDEVPGSANSSSKDKTGKEYDFASQKAPIHRFADAMREDYQGELSYLEVIEKTRIPLVKLTHAPTRISVDVSFNQPSGPPAAQLMKRYLEALPPLRPLTFVLKYFLAARELNVPYSGGVGSYMLQLMIVSFLQQREREAKNCQHPSVYNLGSLLLEFLELYGVELNYITTGISVRFDGFFFPKGAADRKAVFCTSRGYNMLALENPLEPTQDVGQSSFRYSIVQRAFRVAYHIVLAHATAAPHEVELREAPSILAAILPPTDYMTSRLVLKRRDRPLAAPRSATNNNNNKSGGNSNKRGYSGNDRRGDDPKRTRR